MKWTEALASVHKPTLTNREASGLIRFGRSVFAAYGRKPSIALTPFDWYAFALPALGWFQQGDKFKVDDAQQLAPYPTPLQLWEQLNGMARELDDQGVTFRMVTDPRGNTTGFRALANEAWTAMKADRASHASDDGAREIPGTPGHGTSDDPWVITPTRTKQPSALPAASSSTSSGGGGLLLLLLLVAMTSGKGRR